VTNDANDPVTTLVSTKLTIVTGENTTNTASPQPSPKQPSPTTETQITPVTKPESTSTNESESSGTNESEKGVMTRLKAVSKGKEIKEVNEAEDPEAKAKLLRAKARLKKMQQDAIENNEQDKDEVATTNSPQPSPPGNDPQVRSPAITFKTETSVTTPIRSPSTKTSSSTPSDLTKSDASETKTQTPTGNQDEPKTISELLPINTKEDLDDVNKLLGNFLGRAKKGKKKEEIVTSPKSMDEHIISVDRKIKDHKKAHSSPTKSNMKEPFSEIEKPPKTIDRISRNSEGGMSLKTVQEHEDKAAKAKLKAKLEAEGINAEEEFPNYFLPDEAKMTDANQDKKGSKTTGMSEFVKDLYESAGIEPTENKTTSIEPAEAEIMATSSFADDACQCAEIAGDGDWKIPKNNKKNRKPNNPFGQFSPVAMLKHDVARATGIPNPSSGSVSDSTACSPGQNGSSPLAEEKNDDIESPGVQPTSEKPIDPNLPHSG